MAVNFLSVTPSEMSFITTGLSYHLGKFSHRNLTTDYICNLKASFCYAELGNHSFITLCHLSVQ